MSLKFKIVLALIGVTALLVPLDTIAHRVIVSRGYQGLERIEAEKDLARALACIQAEADELGTACAAYADWLSTDQARYAIRGPSTLAALLEESELDVVYLRRKSGEPVARLIVDAAGEPVTDIKQFPAELVAGHPLMGGAFETSEGRSGIMHTDLGPMFVSSRAVEAAHNADDQETLVLILGRLIPEGSLSRLGDRYALRFDAWHDSPDLPVRVKAIKNDVTEKGAVAVELEGGELGMYEAIPDIEGTPYLYVEARVPRTMTAEAERAIHSSLLSTIATAILLLITLTHLLQRIVTRPLSTLTAHAVTIGRTDDTSRRLDMDRDDEIGQLSREFDGMVEKLEKSRQEVVEIARVAGMSEISTGILHNVGNVLNSVNVAARGATDSLAHQPTGDLELAVKALKANKDNLDDYVADDERGRFLIPFMSELSGTMIEQRRRALAELAEMEKGVEHIVQLLASLQSYPGRSGVIEWTSLSEQVETAIKFGQEVSGTDLDLEVVQDFEELPRIRIDRHRLISVLVNLILNAVQALEPDSVETKRLTLRLVRGKGRTARIEIEDTGVGIASENLVRIFNHGFTTRKGGSGFGLHVAANTASELGGSLSVRSEGLGKGATFVLVVPLTAENGREAA